MARLDCESGLELEPEHPIGELRLSSAGRFSVTWTPFEHFVDYAGQYRVSEINGTIELLMGYYAPSGARGKGRFIVTEQGELLLEEIWLGARSHGSEPEACGHRFRPRSSG